MLFAPKEAFEWGLYCSFSPEKVPAPRKVCRGAWGAARDETRSASGRFASQVRREGGGRTPALTWAMGTAHRATPNPTATVLCHGLSEPEKQRFFKLAATGTHRLYLDTEVQVNRAQPPVCEGPSDLATRAPARAGARGRPPRRQGSEGSERGALQSPGPAAGTPPPSARAAPPSGRAFAPGPGVDVYEVDPQLCKHRRPKQTLLQARVSSGPPARSLRVPAWRRGRAGAVKFPGPSALGADFISPPPAPPSRGGGNSRAGRASQEDSRRSGGLAPSRWDNGRAVGEERPRPRAWEASPARGPPRGAGRRGPLGGGEKRAPARPAPRPRPGAVFVACPLPCSSPPAPRRYLKKDDAPRDSQLLRVAIPRRTDARRTRRK